MSFSSVSFLIFMVAVFIIYWILPQKYRWVALLAANVVFYASYEARFLLLILFVTLVSYFCALFMDKYQEHKKVYLTISVLITLGFLVVYKYAGLALETVEKIANLMKIPVQESTLRLLQPIGISFFSFQIIGYLADVYRGKQEAVRHFGKYAVFVSFFPNITSGPIERASHFIPQIDEEKKFDYECGVYGLSLILIGLLKKVVIADSISKYVDAVFNNVSGGCGFSFVFATILFTVQIYCDFAGYSDMALGVAKLMGFDLLVNFKQPYFASSIKEFWSRWHISLSTWLRDYVYIPLGGNRCSKARRNFNLIVTFLVSGLWHGANWTFLLWGGIHGVAQVIENSVKEIAAKRTKKNESINDGQIVQWFGKRAITLIVVSLAWIFFRANSVSDAFYIVSHLFMRGSLSDALMSMGMSMKSVLKVIIMIASITVYDYYSLKYDLIEKFRKIKLPIRWIAYVALATLVIVLKIHNGTDASFIYARF